MKELCNGIKTYKLVEKDMQFQLELSYYQIRLKPIPLTREIAYLINEITDEAYEKGKIDAKADILNK